MSKKILFAAASLFLIVDAFVAGVLLVSVPHTRQTAAVPDAVPKVTLDPASLEARSAVLYDLTTGRVLYEKDAQAQLPLASLTKLMSAEAVLASREPATTVAITAADLVPEGDWGLQVGDVVSIQKLLTLGLVASCNDCMAAATASLGSGYLAAMNSIAMRLGLTKTYFLNPTGLDQNETDAGAYGSAYDVARLTAAFYKNNPEYFELSTRPKVTITVGGRALSFAATTVPLQDMPGFVGGKTGYTDLAGGNLSAVFDLDIGRKVVAVVLHSTEAGRFADVRALIQAARAQLMP